MELVSFSKIWWDRKKLFYLVCCIRQNVKMGERGAGSIWFVQDHHFECVLLTTLNIVFPSQNHDTICWRNYIRWLKAIRNTEVFLFICFICWRPCCGCGCAVRACAVLITRNASLFCPLPNLSYLALKIAHYSFIALKDDCSFFFPTLESAGRLLFVENEWSLLLSLGIVLHALMEALGRGKRVADGLL